MTELPCTCSHKSCVSLVPIFNHLDQESMDRIATKARPRSFERGEYLYQAQENNDVLYIINKGKVKIFQLSESGKEQLIRILTPGDFTGEWTLFNPGTLHENYAQAMVNTEVCLIRQEDFQEILEKYPKISMELLTEISKRLTQSEKQTATVTSESVSSRLAIFLTDLIEDPDELEPLVKLPLAKKDIASYLGTTPETISRRFRDLEEAGLITQLPKQQIKILEVDELLMYGDE